MKALEAALVAITQLFGLIEKENDPIRINNKKLVLDEIKQDKIDDEIYQHLKVFLIEFRGMYPEIDKEIRENHGSMKSPKSNLRLSYLCLWQNMLARK